MSLVATFLVNLRMKEVLQKGLVEVEFHYEIRRHCLQRIFRNYEEILYNKNYKYNTRIQSREVILKIR